MDLIARNGAGFYCFDHLAGQDRLTHGIFTRKGGHSIGPYQGLNVTFGLGDPDETVRANRDLIAQTMGVSRLVFVRQVHGRHVVALRAAAALQTDNVLPPEGDALVTDQPGLGLVIQVADCQPVLLCDPVRKVIANVHSGWRGSVADIIGATVATMRTEFQCRPQDLLAGIGPSLGPCCAEFIHYRQELPEAFWRFKDDDCHFDFWAASAAQLERAGVPAKNIRTAGLCTKCNPDLFFSYRAAKETGRFAAVIGLTAR